ncbi:MAG TPA: flagellar biosynthetic protein FliR [Steroidobacteraceae bacterium]|nr:flagellar biosynthetic protein FliR [Steroidobacteraceae bacterium]
MTVSFNLGWLVATALLSIRVATATALTAVFGPTQVPGAVRVLVASMLAGLMVSVGGFAAPQIETMGQLLVAGVGEALIGAALALGFLAAYAATQVAGRVLDTQMGFGIASIFNPATRDVSPLLGTVLGMAAISIFLAIDGHHQIIRALALSIKSYPPGSSLSAMNAGALLLQSGLMFSFALALAAPTMCMLLMADIAMAVFARSMPQLNIFVMGFAIKIMLGLIVLIGSIRLSLPVFNALFRATFNYWSRIAVGA